MYQIGVQVHHLVTNLDERFGGPARSVPYLCHYLKKLGVESILYSVKRYHDESNSLISELKLKWYSYNYRLSKKVGFNAQLRKQLQDIKIYNTIIHNQSLWTYPPYCGYTVHKKLNIPLVISPRSTLYKKSLLTSWLKKKLAFRMFVHSMLSSASCIHVTDINEYTAIRNLGYIAPIAVIPNGVEISEFLNMPDKLAARQHLNIPLDRKYILFLSRIHPRKGLKNLIHAWRQLAEIFIDWDLIIAGPTDDKKYFKQILSLLRNDNKLQNRVIFTGTLSGKERINAFAASNLFVLPSHFENFGMAIAEALASKLPVITTTGTPWAAIRSHNAGWWIELNEENLVKALNEALRYNSYTLLQMGMNGYDLVKQHFSWPDQALKMLQVYQWVLQKRVKPDCVILD